ncbi:MAG: Stp1/IreP family PP2C-type Ser/Thr phosphatase [Acidobacteriota bacterium]|nr:Stp1/IreP family PP2C-type Ser/Thr phosphatase [Acidobacteriota bacterium]
MVALRAGAATHVGQVRTNNQDSHLTADPLYAVADGMGGAAAGEVASALAIEALSNGFHRSGEPTADLLIQAAQAANRAVWDEAAANPEMRGMGTTLVAIALVDGPELAIINIGDSRLYVLHDHELRQITFDHNLVAEMVAEGRITPAEAEVHPRRNIMTRALGVEPEVAIDLFVEEPVPGDRYLLCSDGLPREVHDGLITSLLERFSDPAEAARELVDEANRRGGGDNITVVVVDIVDQGDDATLAANEFTVAGDATTALAALGGPAPPLLGAVRDADAPADAPDAPPAEQPPEPTRAAWHLPARPTRSVLTGRVVGFILLFLIIVIGAAAGVVWYARSSYFVGLKGSQIVIYQGRPGGVLGINPTLKRTTPYTTSDVLDAAVPVLRAGKEEASLTDAENYVQSLRNDYQTSQQNAAPPSTTPTSSTTVAPTTTIAATTPTKAAPATAPTTAPPAGPTVTTAAQP